MFHLPLLLIQVPPLVKCLLILLFDSYSKCEKQTEQMTYVMTKTPIYLALKVNKEKKFIFIASTHIYVILAKSEICNF